MKGVLNKKYSQKRKAGREYDFRYKTRSLLVHYAVSKFLNLQASSSNPHLLDFGAADGLNLLELNVVLKGDWTLSGIEYSTELIAEAPEFPLNISLRRGDITKPLQEHEREKCDVVSALAVLEHLENPTEAVKNAEVALKSGGVFVATSPVPFWDKLASRLGLLQDDQHNCHMNSVELHRCLDVAGVKVVEIGKFMWAPISFLPYLGIKIAPSTSLKIDGYVRKLKVFNCLFVNQYVIGRKL